MEWFGFGLNYSIQYIGIKDWGPKRLWMRMNSADFLRRFKTVKSFVCSGQLILDSILRFSSAATGEMPPLNA